ncbi:hypothetical protein [Defluviicoccus vanus]|uniref:Uncharacterized protein n=1 Tax=Defluviicoccus vanus TaxID=111831 RepID=A0A7H1MYP1_9PROT|nr:hypothetical protein [Defluviicoccus vanus]QNT68577.1 hypothetical protein HQ394_03330 [Defluviicoccus vanus]
MNPQPHSPPPTLPLPRPWKLVVASIVVVSFLYWMYRTGEKEGEAPPPPAAQSSLTIAVVPV